LETLESAIDRVEVSEARKKTQGCGILAISHSLYVRNRSYNVAVGCTRPREPGLEKLSAEVFSTIDVALELASAGYNKKPRTWRPTMKAERRSQRLD